MFKSIRNTFLSLYTVFKHLTKKSVTLKYPEEKQKMGQYFRGKLFVHSCRCCKTCIQVCPTNAISITKKTKNSRFIRFDLEKCIFCGNCVFYCPFGAIQMLNDYELGTENKEGLKLTYEIEG